MRRRSRSRKKLFIIGFAFLLIVLLGKPILQGIQFAPLFFQLLFNRSIDLKKTDGDKINLLLLGTGGGNHEGPNLSDTIIFVSIDTKVNRVSLISIPRDLWMPDLKAKINYAYAYGESKQKGGGLLLAKAAVKKVVGQQIDYGVRIDFAGFIKAVTMVGGLDVAVDNTLDDYEYPIEGKENDSCGHTDEEIQALASASSQLEAFPCRYRHLHVDKGIQHMNGEMALAYVRSRHAVGEEGTDFARSKRQEKIISAFKQKIFSAQTFLNPAKMLDLYGVLKSSIDTDIQPNEFDDFLRLAQKMKGAKIVSSILDLGDTKTQRVGLLIHPEISEIFDNEWVLIPRIGNGNFLEIHQFVACRIIKDLCPIAKVPKE